MTLTTTTHSPQQLMAVWNHPLPDDSEGPALISNTALPSRDPSIYIRTRSNIQYTREVHHREHWVRDHGKTSVATGILLCWRHHHHVHDKGIEIRHTKAGHFVFTRADGTTF